jgi:hypothetical protein
MFSNSRTRLVAATHFTLLPWMLWRYITAFAAPRSERGAGAEAEAGAEVGPFASFGSTSTFLPAIDFSTW